MDAQAATDRRKEFLRSYLHLIRADVVEQGEALDITFLGEQSKIFRKQNVKVCFSTELSARYGYELVHAGSKLLESIYQDCLNHADVVIYRLKGGEPLSANEILSVLRLDNCKTEFEGSFPHTKYAYAFIFQILYNSEDIASQILWVPVDAETFEPLTWLTLGTPFEESIPARSRPRLLTTERANTAYKAAVACVKDMLDPDFRRIELDVQAHLAEELGRIHRYYSRLKEEEKHRLDELERQLKEVEEKLKRHKTPDTFQKYQEEKRRLQGKIDELKSELGSYFERIDDLAQKEREREQRKHQITCEINLISICFIHYEAHRHRILLFNEHSQGILDLYSIPVTRNLNLPRCLVCKKETNVLSLCANSHIACGNCRLTCAKCGKTFCLSCLKQTKTKSGAKYVCLHCFQKGGPANRRG